MARVKCGDPFVFDRGGPEALFLHEQGIGFEVIPGVTAFVAAPSFAGIPVTYPGAGDTVTFLRAFDDETRRAPAVRTSGHLARLRGTVVCAIAARQLPHVASTLLAHGRLPDETAAFIVDGTCRRNRRWRRRSASWRRRSRPRPVVAWRARRRRGGRLRDHLLVRQPAAVRPPRAGDAVARPGARSGRAARTERGGGGRGAGTADQAARRSRPARSGGGGGGVVRLDRVHEHERRGGAGHARAARGARPAGAGGAAHLRRRAGDGLEARPLRRQGRPRAGRPPSLGRRHGARRRRRPQGRARSAAVARSGGATRWGASCARPGPMSPRSRRIAPRRWRATPTSDVSRAAGSAPRRGDVHERDDGARVRRDLWRRTGARPAGRHRRGDDRAGRRRRGGARRHQRPGSSRGATITALVDGLIRHFRR